MKKASFYLSILLATVGFSACIPNACSPEWRAAAMRPEWYPEAEALLMEHEGIAAKVGTPFKLEVTALKVLNTKSQTLTVNVQGPKGSIDLICAVDPPLHDGAPWRFKDLRAFDGSLSGFAIELKVPVLIEPAKIPDGNPMEVNGH